MKSLSLEVISHSPDCWPCVSAEPASPSLDSEATMEVDNSDVNSDGGHSIDEQDEASTPEDKLYFIEGSSADGEKDDETLRAIRWAIRVNSEFPMITSQVHKYSNCRGSNLDCIFKHSYCCMCLCFLAARPPVATSLWCVWFSPSNTPRGKAPRLLKRAGWFTTPAATTW